MAFIYCEDLGNYIQSCKHDEYERSMWVEITLFKGKLSLASCYTRRECSYYNLYELDHDDSCLYWKSVGCGRFQC